MERGISVSQAEEMIFQTGFACQQVGRVGVEIEWLVVSPGDPDRRLPISEIEALLDTARHPLPHGGAVSFEPGGQLELSTKPFDDLGGCVTAAAGDMQAIQSRLALGGLLLVGQGLDLRKPKLVTTIPRYRALEAHYAQFGYLGRMMMGNSASIQVNVDAGDDSTGWRGRARRWILANSLGPVLIAMFANSPGPSYAPAKSHRQVIRFGTDPSRTDPLPLDIDPRLAWTEYALNALVVGIPEDPPMPWSSPPVGLTMRKWLQSPALREVSQDDLGRHLKSVIPPVRPCGYLEIRMIDSQSEHNWVVPVAVVTALLDDPLASTAALAALSHLPTPTKRAVWVDAARLGLDDPLLANAARHCLEIAIEALPRLHPPPWTLDAVKTFAATYTHRRRCPADDLQLSEWW